MSEQQRDVAAHEAGQAPPPRRRRRWKMPVLCAVVLVCGFVSGYGVALMRVAALRGHSVQDRMLQFFDSRLDFSDEQEAQVQAILDETHESIMALRRDTRPKLREAIESAQQRIEKLLTPEQHEKWDAVRKELRERSSELHGRGRHGGRRGSGDGSRRGHDDDSPEGPPGDEASPADTPPPGDDRSSD